MNLFKNILPGRKRIAELENKLAVIHELEKRIAEISQINERSFNAAATDRIFADWNSFLRSYNYDIKQAGVSLRARARELAQNDPYAKKILFNIKRGVVGPTGFTLRARSGDYQLQDDGTTKFIYDKLANLKIQNAFWEWSKKKYCTLKGNVSFRELCGNLMQSVFREGEVFVIHLKGKRYNKFGYTLQIVNPDYLDEKLIKDLPNGNTIVMGIEFNPDGQVVNYWFNKKRSLRSEVETNSRATSEYQVVPASMVSHLFFRETDNQIRGITQFAPSAVRLKLLYDWEEAGGIRAKASANVAWVLQKQTNTMMPGAMTSAPVNNADATLVEQAKGEIYKAPDGYEVKNMESDYPHPMHTSYVDVNLHSVASASDQSYHSISSNYTGMNYTVSRTALLDERDSYQDKQAWLNEQLLEDVGDNFTEMGILSGAITLPYAKLEKFQERVWLGRGYKWVSPGDEVDANIKAMAAGIKTLEEVIAETSNKDLEEHLDQLAYEAELKKKYKALGVEFNLTTGAPKPAAAETPAGNNGNGSNGTNGNGKKHFVTM